MSKTVAILGAGFGGLSAALEFAQLKKKLSTDEQFEVVLIDKNGYQLFTPDLYEIASASREITSEEQLKETICLNVSVALGQKSITFLKAEVTGVDTSKQIVSTSKKDVKYDYLLVALGSESFYFGIPGMKENSIGLKQINEATEIRSTIHKLVEKKDNVHVLVCGGGPAGVELAAEMRIACKNSTTGTCPAITIVEGQSTILAPFPVKVQKKVTQRMKVLGVKLKTNFFIAKAEPGKVTSKEGEELSGDLIVWTGGVTASTLLGSTGLQLTKKGQLPTQQTLQTIEMENVFAVGDAAETHIGEEFCPMTGHEAIEQGPVAARNILHHMHGEQMELYRLKKVGYVITMGGKHGIVSFQDKIILTGFIGWAARKWIDFKHFRSVLPFMRACSVWYKGVTIMSKND